MNNHIAILLAQAQMQQNDALLQMLHAQIVPLDAAGITSMNEGLDQRVKNAAELIKEATEMADHLASIEEEQDDDKEEQYQEDY